MSADTAVLARTMPNEDYINPRNMGFFYSDSFTDSVAKALYEGIPPSSEETLPAYWSYRSHGEFLERFGHLGQVVWSRRTTYSLLLMSGTHAMKVYTLGKYSRVELNTPLMGAVHGKLVGLKVNPNLYFQGCVSIQSLSEVPVLIEAVRRVYGLASI